MEEVQEQKFVCKFCSKSFFTGKSLGGHMRGHLAMISAQKQKDHNDSKMGLEGGGHTGYGLRQNPKKILRVSDSENSTLNQEKLKNSDMDFEGGVGHASYGLRENPKKSWRVSDPKHGTSRKENLCKKCGKGFHTLRALSGHMRCHSMEEREENLCKKCGKGFDSMRALFGHMRSHSKRSRVSQESVESQSDYETACPIRKKRSSTRYKITANSSLSNLNASSSVSDIDGVEDVAMCLMMLSRDVRNWAGFNSVTESSDNNSVIFEAQLSHPSKGIARKLVCNNGDETWKMKNPGEKLNSYVLGSGNALFDKNISEFGEFDSGYARDDEKKVELEVSVDGILRGDEFNKPKLDDESGIELTEVELEKDLTKEVVLDQADSELVKSTSSKKEFDDHDSELGGNSFERTNQTISDLKKREYKCRTCKKIFHSHRALGGHRTSHKTVTSTSVVKSESIQTSLLSDIEANSKLKCNENSLEEEVNGVAVTSNELKKSKDHECPVCFKVFASGQALGGHKRAHYVGLSESRAKETMLIEQELPDIQNLIDLNLPVTIEKEANDAVGFKLWWVGSDHEREPLVISN
uniref:C2H2-type domain-containing protein n=1 Tax=Davidia involucrata TaxID=16924 RepID=A0A5B6YV08_DAVIN